MTELELNNKLTELGIQQMPSTATGRKTGRQYRRTQSVRKDDRLMRLVIHQYIPHAGYIDGSFEGDTLLHSGKYIKYMKNSKAQQWLKRCSSKCTRRCADMPVKGNYYRRLFEYWWMLY